MTERETPDHPNVTDPKSVASEAASPESGITANDSDEIRATVSDAEGATGTPEAVDEPAVAEEATAETAPAAVEEPAVAEVATQDAVPAAPEEPVVAEEATPDAASAPTEEPAVAEEASADAAATPAVEETTAPEESPEQEIELLEFASLALPAPVLQAIDDLGFARGTPIQSATLPWSLSDYDIVGQAQTGTGKTAAFLLTILSRLWENPEAQEPPMGRPRNLVLAPTRELALQIASDAEDLSKHTPFNVLAVVGGMDFDRQLAVLRNQRVDLIVATPGRLIDFIERRVIDLSAVEVLVIDEADRMLDMGFIPDVRKIVYRTPHKRVRQTMFFSATFNDDVHRLADQWTTNPFKVAIAADRPALDSITQEMYNVANTDKFKVLYNLITKRDLKRVLVFNNRRDSTREVYQRLRGLGVDCDMLAGDVPQRKRLSTLERFKDGRIRVLVATDVAGRGLHVDDISHVVNFNLPEDPEDYVHRIGRTGRAGAKGISISLVCEDEGFKVAEIEDLLKMKLDFMNPDPELLETPPRANRSNLPDDDDERAPVFNDKNGRGRSGGSGGGRGRSPDGRRGSRDQSRAAPAKSGEPRSNRAAAPTPDTQPPAPIVEDPDPAVEENIGNRIDGAVPPPDSIARAFLEADDDMLDAQDNIGNVVDDPIAEGDTTDSGDDDPQIKRRRRRRRRRPAGDGDSAAGDDGDAGPGAETTAGDNAGDSADSDTGNRNSS